ncbi:H-type lectin domain-containing protein [Cutibacterium avidum]|uniref:H-type lectin domain-containing protein n=1 Tax=Cutibacterium avidum TaxID=33010 RepID=UPI002FF23E23
MAGSTTNRNYPFPTTGDPVDIPGDVKKLATAIDTDVAAIKQTADATKAATDSLGFGRFESGTKDVRPSGSAAYTYQISFRNTFATPPSVVASRGDSLPGGTAAWAVTASKVTTTGFTLTVYTVDGVGAGGSAPITAVWQAFGR